jgi:hypothetical protein
VAFWYYLAAQGSIICVQQQPQMIAVLGRLDNGEQQQQQQQQH